MAMANIGMFTLSCWWKHFCKHYALDQGYLKCDLSINFCGPPLVLTKFFFFSIHAIFSPKCFSIDFIDAIVLSNIFYNHFYEFYFVSNTIRNTGILDSSVISAFP